MLCSAVCRAEEGFRVVEARRKVGSVARDAPSNDSEAIYGGQAFPGTGQRETDTCRQQYTHGQRTEKEGKQLASRRCVGSRQNRAELRVM